MAAKKKSKTKNQKLVRILSIDGGGIRGILPGQILVRLEEILQTYRADARIADYFDFVAGTSTGGILSCLYLLPDSQQKPRPLLSAKEAVDLYLERGDEIFSISFWQRVRSGGGISDEKYDAGELEEALKQYFEETWLRDLMRPCLITSYDIKRREPRFFTQHNASAASKDFLVRDVARATSAAPTYFEAARIYSRSRIPYPLIDGGVFANNPTMCAYAECRNMDQEDAGGRIRNPRAKDIAILSLGTGGKRKSYAWSEAKDWGAIGWIKPVIDIMMAGSADTVDFQMKRIYEAVGKPAQYLRIEPDLGDAVPDMDDASEDNLRALREAGIEAAEEYDAKLKAFAKLLHENR
ncbi:MAG: patatin-like phospholipase family protein [Planctomycetota bacterium]